MTRWSAVDATIRVNSTIRLLVDSEERLIPVLFMVILNLAFSVIVGTAFIDKHVESIGPYQRMASAKRDRELSILASFSNKNISTVSLERQWKSKNCL